MSILPVPPSSTKPGKIPIRVNSAPIQPCLSLLELCKHTNEFTQIHSKFIKLGLIHNPLAFTKLLGYCSISPSADMKYSQSIFDCDNKPNSFAYNVMIRGYAQKNQPENALSMFYKMICNGNSAPNNLTFPFVLKACSRLNAVEEGKQVHGQVFKYGLSEDLFVQNSLITLYSSCGFVDFARQVFEKIAHPDIVSWNSVITGLVGAGFVEEGRWVFERMPKRNAITWNCLIDGYVKSGSLEEARELFNRMDWKDSITWNTMISGYVGSGCLEDARGLFYQMPREMKDLITFNLMVDGYATKGEYEEVLEIFQEMQEAKIEPNRFTMVNVLSACSYLVALEQGEWIQAYIDRNGIELDAVLGTALVDMFAKCGKIERALSVFENMEERDVGAWNSIIHNLGVHGNGKEALALFSDLLKSDTPPDEITFLGVLSACRHSGLVDEGKRYFRLMSEVYNLVAKVEHYGCMVDLLARADLLDEARDLIETLEVKSSIPMWGALLGASSRLGNLEMGEYAAKHLMELDPFDSSCYVVLSNIYSAAGMYEKAIEIKKKMKDQGIEKAPGCSLIEISGVLHEFRVGSDSLE